MPRKFAIGLDFGTTNSCAFVLRNNNLEGVPIYQGTRLLPSVVQFNGEEILVGIEALRSNKYNQNFIRAVKRLIRMPVDNVKHLVPYDLEDDRGSSLITVNFQKRFQKFRPEEICAIILEELKYNAKIFLDETDITDVVISVPAKYDEGMRVAVRNAAEMAGLKCIAMINEPTAAALAYVYSNKLQTAELFLVLDIGGGTTDITIAKMNDGIIQVLKNDGDLFLGGEDFDNALVKHCIEKFYPKKADTLFGNQKYMKKCLTTCQQIKHALSIAQSHTVVFECGETVSKTVSLAEFNEVCRSLFNKIEYMLSHCFVDCGEGITQNQIKTVILVGGSSRMQNITLIMKKIFPQAQIKKEINSEEVVAMGAAIQAAKLTTSVEEYSESFTVLDISSNSLGLRVAHGKMEKLILKGASIPSSSVKTFTTTRDNQTTIPIRVYQGEDANVEKNVLLCEYILKDIEKAAKGKAHINVQFSLTADYMLHVSASEQNGNKEIKFDVCALGRALRKVEMNRIKEIILERRRNILAR